jgi:hypothetical protein
LALTFFPSRIFKRKAYHNSKSNLTHKKCKLDAYFLFQKLPFFSFFFIKKFLGNERRQRENENKILKPDRERKKALKNAKGKKLDGKINFTH